MHLTEELNALDYLEKTHLFTSRVYRGDSLAWKWVIISLHHAMYGFAICALKGTAASTYVISENKQLITFPEAIRRCQKKEYMHMLITSKVLLLTESQEDSIGRMHKDFRNNFMHYIPKGWSIEVSGMPTIVIDCLEVTEFLALETGNFTKLDDSEREKIKKIVKETKLILNSLSSD